VFCTPNGEVAQRLNLSPGGVHPATLLGTESRFDAPGGGPVVSLTRVCFCVEWWG
jgi:hypothetical protein